MDDHNGQELGEQIGKILNGQDIDVVIPVLAAILANAAVYVCNDRDVFIGYMTQVIAEAYDEVDHSDETLQ
jgi:hypothetical protein